jgi:hypothetical protein
MPDAILGDLGHGGGLVERAELLAVVAEKPLVHVGRLSSLGRWEKRYGSRTCARFCVSVARLVLAAKGRSFARGVTLRAC